MMAWAESASEGKRSPAAIWNLKDFAVGTRVVKAPFFKANLKAVSKRLIKAVKRLLYVVNMMNDCFKMHYTSVHLVVSNRHHDKTIEP